jgi:PqqA peptide cyclase
VNAPRPWTLVAELTYACPLRCAYCSNPPRIGSRAPALASADWQSLLEQAQALGVVQVHFTGGEPLLCPDLEPLVATANRLGLYSTLVTSGIPLERSRLQALAERGLEHVQLSIQAARAETARAVCGRDALEQKLRVASWVKELGLSLTLNIVLHRLNLAELPELLELAERVRPDRLELAHAQYLGWALQNRDQLLPSAESLNEARALIRAARETQRERFEIVAVLPDYHAGRPRACMDGWAQHYLVITPSGQLLPCHAAHALPLEFDDVRSAPLAQLWATSAALQRFRGTDWMQEPCASCDQRHEDAAGCRCQAFALTGDAGAPDPTCRLTPAHQLVRSARERAERSELGVIQLRRHPSP